MRLRDTTEKCSSCDGFGTEDHVECAGVGCDDQECTDGQVDCRECDGGGVVPKLVDVT